MMGTRLGLVLASALLCAAPAMAQDTPPSPAGEIYQMGSPYGWSAYRVRFGEDGVLSLDYNGTHPPLAQGRAGQWIQDAEGAVTITGEALPLFARGTDSVRCEHWPEMDVGEYFDEPPCWWTGESSDGTYQRVE